MLPKSDRINLYWFFSQGNYKKELLRLLDKVGLTASDTMVKWEPTCDRYPVERRREPGVLSSFVVVADKQQKALNILPDPAVSWRMLRSPDDGRLTVHQNF